MSFIFNIFTIKATRYNTFAIIFVLLCIIPQITNAFFDIEKVENELLLQKNVLQVDFVKSLERSRKLSQLLKKSTDIEVKKNLKISLKVQSEERVDYQNQLIVIVDRLKSIYYGKKQQNIQLKVPLHIQEKSLSCEIAALKMVLDYYNFNVSESELENQLVFVDPKKYENGIWGNPHNGFVGDIDGDQDKKSGYGVYWQPIKNIATKYKANSYDFEHATLDKIVQELYLGHPVIAWIPYGLKAKTYEMSWYTPDGQYIKAYNGEHSVVITGFTGSLLNPGNFIIANPLTKTTTIPVKKFADKWSMFNYSGVVVK